MTENLRLFVGVKLPEQHIDTVDDACGDVRTELTGGRWVTKENQHVTLKFLGSSPSDRLEAIEQICEMVARGREAASLKLTGLGAFPNEKRVRVLWVGIEDPAGLLAGLAGDLEQGFEPLGYASEDRDYTPHLTLCRFKVPLPVRDRFPSIDVSALPSFTVDRMHLFRSHLSPRGARYESLREFPLGAAA